ncbi:uncharacterized protein G2W53_026353 [Senna tora]|uniref:Uncharacterized protein n=1 Tax=Senna tora TaxID=362788 RepID=A0A834TF03_9FABA|nr:uncharacterized protein G2W53_026353 [Senna tora]
MAVVKIIQPDVSHPDVKSISPMKNKM